MSSPVNKPLHGVLPVLHTPFTDSGAIDGNSLQREIDWAFEIGADGVVVAMVSEVRVNGEAVQMTPTEFQILQTLAKKPGRVFRRSELLRGPSGASFSDERTVDAHVRSIRQKLGSDGELVQTVRGKGYRIMDDGS